MKGNSLSVEESIRLEAYLLSEKAGHPPDMDTMFWAQAEQIVHGRIAAVAPSGVTKFVKAPAAPLPADEVPVRKPAARKRAKSAAPVPEDKQLLLAPETPAVMPGTAAPRAKSSTTTAPKATGKATTRRTPKSK